MCHAGNSRMPSALDLAVAAHCLFSRSRGGCHGTAALLLFDRKAGRPETRTHLLSLALSWGNSLPNLLSFRLWICIKTISAIILTGS